MLAYVDFWVLFAIVIHTLYWCIGEAFKVDFLRYIVW